MTAREANDFVASHNDVRDRALDRMLEEINALLPERRTLPADLGTPKPIGEESWAGK